MKKVMLWLGMLVGMLLALVLTDRQTPKTSEVHKPMVFGQGRPNMPFPPKDWQVQLRLSHLSRDDAVYYKYFLIGKFSEEMNVGRAVMTVQEGAGNGIQI